MSKRVTRTLITFQRKVKTNAGSGRGAPTQAEAVFERTDGFMRCKLGPPAFAAGMSEPSLSVVTEIEWAGPLRPLGEVEIKKTIPVPRFVK